MEAFIYLLRIPEKGIYKIGVAKNVERRLKQLQTGNPEPIILVSKFKSERAYKIESILHRRYSLNRIEGEWFYLTDSQVDNFNHECMLLEENLNTLAKYKNPFI